MIRIEEGQAHNIMKKLANLGLALIVIGLIMIAFAMFFFFEPVKDVQLDFDQLNFAEKIDAKDEIILDATKITKDQDIQFLESLEGNRREYFLGEDIPFNLDVSRYRHNGKYKVSLDAIIYDPDGKIDTTLSKKNVDSADSDINKVTQLNYNVKIPGDKPSGEYIIELILNDLIDGEKYVKRNTVKLTKKLFIRSMLYASSIDDTYNYVAKPKPAYAYGDTVWVYFELVGFSKDKNRIHFAQDLEVRGPDSSLISFLTVPYLIEKEEFVAPDKNFYRLKNQFPVGDWLTPGKYIVKVTVNDLVADISISEEAEFELFEI